jgi:hypothetical protein
MLTVALTLACEEESTATARSAENDGGPIEWSEGRSWPGAAAGAPPSGITAGAKRSSMRDLRNKTITVR